MTDTDVCIVGAGAAGGIMALELGRRGIKVVVLEAGPRHDFNERSQYVRAYLRGENPWRSRLAGQDLYTVGGTERYGLANRRARGVGGSTLYWEGYTLRFHETDFRLRSLHRIADDWPIGYDELEPYYAHADSALGVAGIADDPWASPRSTPFPLPAFPFSHSDGLFAKACRSVGVALHCLPQARNSVACGGRSQCRACGTCHVCPTGAKASIDLTHVPAAERTGHVRILSDATVLRLDIDRSGDVHEAIYTRVDRVEHRLRARIFVLAAGAVENARLLLSSTSARFPTGLANRSGLVGKFFMCQPFADVTGRVRDRVFPYRIGFSTGMSRQFAADAKRAARGGYYLEFLNSAGPKPDEIAVTSGLSGEALRRRVQEEFGRTLGIRIYCEHLPNPASSISLDRQTSDCFGIPVPHVTYEVGQYERAALDEAGRVAERILQTLGATDINWERIEWGPTRGRAS